MNISDDLYVDRPSSVVEILRIEEDNQTGQEHSLSSINRSHRSLHMQKEKVNIQDKSIHCAINQDHVTRYWLIICT